MLTDRIQLMICYALIIGLLGTSSWLGVKNYQLSNEVDSQAKTIVTHENTIAKNIDEIADLKASIRLQNTHIDELEIQTAVAITKAEEAQANSKPKVDAEERQIVGIRSARKATTSDEIRLKMLKDAML